MCKLCNNPTRNSLRIDSRTSPLAYEFIKVVLEYTNEIPCSVCCNNWKNTIVKDRKIPINIDEYIVSKLWKVFTPNYKAYILSNRRTAFKHKYSEGKLCKARNSSNVVEKHISKLGNSYRVQLKNYGIGVKSFKTLEEAQQFKQEVINGNYPHTS